MHTDEKILNLILEGFEQDFIESLYNITDMKDINIFDDLGYDSIKFIQLIVDLEEYFKVEIDDDMLLMENFSTIKQITDLILNLIDDKSKIMEIMYE